MTGTKRSGADSSEAGSALVEFLALSLLLLIPIIYLILTLTQLHAGKFAASSAAHSAARAFVSAPDTQAAYARAAGAVRVALDDQGFSDLTVADALQIACQPDCSQREHEVVVTVTIPVRVPAIPFLERGPAVLTAQDQQIAASERFRGQP